MIRVIETGLGLGMTSSRGSRHQVGVVLKQENSEQISHVDGRVEMRRFHTRAVKRRRFRRASTRASMPASPLSLTPYIPPSTPPPTLIDPPAQHLFIQAVLCQDWVLLQDRDGGVPAARNRFALTYSTLPGQTARPTRTALRSQKDRACC